MPSQGPLSPGATTQYGTGTAWSNTANISASDNSDASVAIATASSPSAFLAGASLGFTVPADAVVNGLLLEIEISRTLSTGNSRRINTVQLSISGTLFGTAKTVDQDVTDTDVVYSYGGASDTWGGALTPAIVNASSFQTAMRVAVGSSTASTTFNVDHMRVTIYYTENTAPAITDAPEVSHSPLSRLGPQNTPAVVAFTATDVEQAGANALDWGIYTATAGGGTEVASGACTSGVPENVNIAYNAPGLAGNGSQTLYLLISDGTLSGEASFVLLQDNVAPLSFTATPDPATVATRSYDLEITAEDATSTATDELTYEIRTAASGGGSLIENGTRTSSGSAFTVASITDNGLENGSNTRYVRVTDGAGNIREVSYVVTGESLPTRVTTLAVSRAKPHPAELITVNIYPPMGKYPRFRLDYDDINPSTTAVSWRSGPGGWTDASVGIAHPLADERYGQPLAYPYLRRSLAQQPFAHVEIRRGPFVVFAGRLGPTQRAGNTSSGFTVNGYGLVGTRDNPYVSADTTLTTSGIVLRSMVSTTAPHLRAASGDDWYDPAVAHAPADFHLMELADALDQVASEGDTVGNQMDWWVYEDQIVVLRARTAPNVPDYHLPNDNNVTWVEDPEWLIGAVTHERTEDGNTVTSSTWDTNPDFVGEHGFQRSQVLQLGEVSADVALALRKTYLRLHSHVFLSGSIELGPDDVLTGPGGRVRPKGLARYGQWVQVGREALLMIVSTDYDATAGVLRMEIGEFVPSFETLVANLQRDRLRRQRRLNARAGRAR